MDYEELPYGVREYLKEDMTQRHFNIQEGSVFFAPGAIYPILPLFVEEPDEAVCEGMCSSKLTMLMWFGKKEAN
jgi:hypothetical protein